MILRSRYSFIPEFFVIVTIYYALSVSSFKYLTNTFLTYIIVILGIWAILRFYSNNKRLLNYPPDKSSKTIIGLFYLLVTITIIRSFITIEGYWTAKSVVSISLVYMYSFIILPLRKHILIFKVIGIWGKYCIIPLLLLLPFYPTSAFLGHVLPLIAFYVMVFSNLSVFKKILLIAILFLMVSDLGARAVVIKYGFLFTIIFAEYFKRVVGNFSLKTVGIVLFLLPIVFFILAATNVFNILLIGEANTANEYVIEREVDGKVVEQDIAVDTRTIFYKEAWESSLKNNYVWFGRSFSKGQDMIYMNFKKLSKEFNIMTRRNEAAILNTYTWTGLVGVFIYILLVYRAIILALFRSRNRLSKYIGIYVAMLWGIQFLNDSQILDTINLAGWFFIGCCYSYELRNLTDIEIKILTKQYLT